MRRIVVNLHNLLDYQRLKNPNPKLNASISCLIEEEGTGFQEVELTSYGLETNKNIYSLELTENEWFKVQYQLSLIQDNVIDVEPKDLEEVLNKYSEKVKESKVPRVRYHPWRSLVSLSRRVDTNVIYFFASLDKDAPESTVIAVIEPDEFIPLDLPDEMFFDILLQAHRSIPPIYATNNNEKENENTMNVPTPSMNIEFGPISGDGVAISPYGLAIRNPKGNYITYNAATGQTTDVTGFTFKFKDLIWKIPVAVNQVRPGDMIVHNGKLMYVKETESNQVTAVALLDSEIKTIIPVTNIFGFNFITKVVPIINMNAGTPDVNNPFGNLMPMMMMSAFMGDGDNKDSSFDMNDMGKMMMLSAMMNSGANNPFANMFNFNTPNT